MAKLHLNRAVVISLDLKDFFTSIKQNLVQHLLTHLGVGGMAARTLSELCTYKSFVPQGALTSPKLSNIVTAYTFGPEIYEFCRQKGYNVTIYADDITVSINRDPQGNANSGGIDANRITEVIEFMTGIVNKYGFKINRKKTKVMYPSQRQYVCGAVVNQIVNLQKSERHELRAIVHHTIRDGVVKTAELNKQTPEKFVQTTMGRLNWFAQLNPRAGGYVLSKFKSKVDEDTPKSTPIATFNEVEVKVSSGEHNLDAPF